MIHKIRTATESDVARCAELLEILFSQEHEFTANAEAQSRALSMIIRNPELGRIFVADIDGMIEGMVMLLFTVSTFLGRKAALLEDMVVMPAWRSKGVGTRLIDHAVDFANREGFGRITLLTDQDNDAAQRFYREHGFARSEMVVFRKILDHELLMKSSESGTWMCRECGYLYDPAEGDPESRIKPGTPFAELSCQWSCPVCFASKTDFDAFS
jgi:rubredoxin/ribosomal protein S18 acetylase RimI-like enzyme